MSFTNAQLATKISDLIAYWSTFSVQYSNWLGGTVSGGPGSDGKYPLTDFDGDESLVESPAKLSDNVSGFVGLASASETAAAASASAAATSESNASSSASTATAQAVLADADRISAETAESGAVDAKVTAIAQAAAAVVSAAAASTDADDAATSAAAALVSELAAAVSAAAAATFDPLNFYLRTALDGGQLDNRYFTEAEINATFANYTLTSGLSITNWNTAYGWGDHASGGYALLSGATFTGALSVSNAARGLNLRAGDTTTVFSPDQILFGYNGAESYRHGIATRHNGGGQVNNAFDFYVWQHGVDAIGDKPTQRVLTIDGDGSTFFSDLTVTGAVTGSNLAVANWNTAYGWGNHASGGYAANTNVSNWDTAYGWGDHASGGYAASGHNHSGVYEPVFSKNTAFNDNYGAIVGTVCQGNDSRLSDARTPLSHTHVEGDITGAAFSNWNTAYGWGDHASGGYAASGHNHSGTYEPADVNITKDNVAETITSAWNFTAAPTKSALGIPYYVSTDYTGGKITVSASAPGSPAKGDIWFDT